MRKRSYKTNLAAPQTQEAHQWMPHTTRRVDHSRPGMVHRHRSLISITKRLPCRKRGRGPASAHVQSSSRLTHQRQPCSSSCERMAPRSASTCGSTREGSHHWSGARAGLAPVVQPAQRPPVLDQVRPPTRRTQTRVSGPQPGVHSQRWALGGVRDPRSKVSEPTGLQPNGC